ncbi:hypothetical protein ACFODL_06790 [Phenylobacterium terrae]|uniref:Uncharacterized protein n=1 Tax=Phenylobacterium terrae TaxID=2665495 RepID=A0ABW4N8J4_9CAUL
MTAASARDVAGIVAAHADTPVEQLRPNTRLWHDLRLAGDDFGDVIEELHRAYGVTLRGGLEEYCRTEADLSWAFLWWPFASWTFKREKRYRDLTIAELATAARSGVQVG